MKQHLVALAIPLALSACLTEPDLGSEPPEHEPHEDEPAAAPTGSSARAPLPPVQVEREFRVQGQPAFDVPNPGGPSLFDATLNSDALAIAGNGDVHVIGHHTWYHFAAGGGAPQATVVQQSGAFERPYAVAMREPLDHRPYVASLYGRSPNNAIRRFDPATHTFDRECNPTFHTNYPGPSRFTAFPSVFHLLGYQAMSCTSNLGFGYAQPTASVQFVRGVRHPYTWSNVANVRSLEVGNAAFSEIRDGVGFAHYRTSLEGPEPGVTEYGLWGVVEPGSDTGYALVAEYENPCPPPAPHCTRSGVSITPVSMGNGAHGNVYRELRSPGSVVGGMLLIEPLSHDLIALVSRTEGAQTFTWFTRYTPQLGWDYSIRLEVPGGVVHDAIIVGDQLFVSMFSPSGPALAVTSLAGEYRGVVTYGHPGDFPMALKKSFDGTAYFMTREGNELVVRKLGRDTDGDGLLDQWETSGIDVDLDGVIDLALHQLPGISPLHKNIVLELDTEVGVTDPMTYWPVVRQMFRGAPNLNPDGTTGIEPILISSEIGFPSSGGPLSMSDEAAYDEGKLGHEAEIDLPNHSAILAARRMATRHVIVFAYRQTETGPLGPVHLFGRTFGLPGEAASFIAIYDDLGPLTPIYNALAADKQLTVRASIFAHELGHALGLRHGGHEEVRLKPNYHSVMNGLHMVPRDSWPTVPVSQLRYAHGFVPALVEDQLDEELGLDMGSHHEAHMLSFMTGPVRGTARRVLGFETTFGIDFDGDGAIESGLVTADVNRDGQITTLEVRSDWDEMDWSLFRSPGWLERAQAHSAMIDDTESLLVGGGWCDPFAASGCTCTVEGQTRPCGTDTGACTAGVQTCRDGFWGLCDGAVQAYPERCDADDNDCDGTSNEDFPALGQACNVGVGACARSGSQVCTADELGTTCNVSPGMPTAERCSNSVDDDCDGATDEGFPTLGQACSVGLGVCRRDATFTCSADGLSATCPVTPGTPGPEVCGNGLDDDCNGLVDECLPTLISPPNGHLTGSGRVTSIGGQYNPRQLTMRWTATSPGATYEIQVDDDMNFASPVVLPTTTGTTYTTFDLPIAQSAPWGRRYWWRVRSRVGQQAPTAWTPSRYVDVGRLPDDVNGDGFADVAIGSLGANNAVTGGGAVYLYHGRSAGMLPSTPTTQIFEFGGQAHAHFGAAHTFADLDGDGFSDLIVGIPDRNVSGIAGVGQVAIYFGGAGGLPTSPSMTIGAPSWEAYANFGFAVAAAGDVDADGYHDVWISAPGLDAVIFWNNRFVSQPNVGLAYLYRGGPRGSISPWPSDVRTGFSPNGFFGATMAATGDVNSDGVTDMAFAAYSAGYVFVYSGASAVVLATLNRPGTTGFGRSIAAGDFDADGGVDLAISAMSPAGFTVHRKDGATFSNIAWFTDNGGGTSGDAHVASGDIDRDGDGDLVIGYPFYNGPGRVVVRRGSSTFSALGTYNETCPTAELGRAVTIADTAGDGRADVFAGAPRCTFTSFRWREGKVVGWSQGASPALGNPTHYYDSPHNQIDGFFGNPMR